MSFYALEEQKYHEYSHFRSEITVKLFGKEVLTSLNTDSFPLLEDHVMLLNGQKLIVVPGNKLACCQDSDIIKKHVEKLLSLPYQRLEWKAVIKDETWPLRQQLEAMRLHQYETSIIMTLEIALLTPSEYELDMTPIRVLDKKSLYDFASVHEQFSASSASYARAHDTSNPIFTQYHFFYVAYKDAIPVTAFALIRAPGGILGLHMVATHPEYRSRRYASTLIRRVLNEFKKEDPSLTRVVLAASRESVEMYARLGFKEIVQVASFCRL